MIKNMKYILIVSMIGIIIGKYIFNEQKQDAISTISNKDNEMYIMQFGVYKNKENMINNTSKLEQYLYYKDDDGYHVCIGITKNLNLKEKIVDSYGLSENIYMKKVKTNNQEFIELLNQYDELINQTDNIDIIKSAQKQILSKYEEMILNSE